MFFFVAPCKECLFFISALRKCSRGPACCQGVRGTENTQMSMMSSGLTGPSRSVCPEQVIVVPREKSSWLLGNQELSGLTRDPWPICFQKRIRLPVQETWETWVQSLGQEDPLEREMAAHSSILAWRIPWIEEPGRLQSREPQRVGHDRSDLADKYAWE